MADNSVSLLGVSVHTVLAAGILAAVYLLRYHLPQRVATRWITNSSLTTVACYGTVYILHLRALEIVSKWQRG